jgi:hypothetical protein
MSSDTPDLQAQLDELREQLDRLQSLRGLLGDELTDQKAQQLESEIRLLVETGGAAVFAGDVEVRQGDLVARDKWQLWVDKLYLSHSPDQVPPDALLHAYLRALAAECSRQPLRGAGPGRQRLGVDHKPLGAHERLPARLPLSLRSRGWS